MSALAYEHKSGTSDAHGYYAAPNEDTSVWRDFVKNLHIQRAAGICSSGEVGLFAMLPTTRKELVLIDHSKRSLSIAMLKYLLIQKQGASEARKLLTCGDAAKVKSTMNEIKADLPKDVQDAFNALLRRNDGYYGSPTRHPFTERKYANVSPRKLVDQPNSAIKQYWEATPIRLIRRCQAKLDRVKFVHGDLSSLEQHGPFDLLYLSNALEHIGVRSAAHEKFVAIDRALKPGGHVLVAGHTEYHRTLAVCDKVWERVESAKAKVGLRWEQVLYRKAA